MFDFNDINIQQNADSYNTYLSYVEKKLCSNGISASVNDHGNIAISFEPYEHNDLSISSTVNYICHNYYEDFICLDSNVLFEDIGYRSVGVPVFMNAYNSTERIFKLLHLIITKISLPPEGNFYFYFTGLWVKTLIDNICDAYKMLIDAGVTDEQLSNYTVRLAGDLHIVCKTPIPRAAITWSELFQRCIHYRILHQDEIERARRVLRQSDK